MDWKTNAKEQIAIHIAYIKSVAINMNVGVMEAEKFVEENLWLLPENQKNPRKAYDRFGGIGFLKKDLLTG